jgi:hypothetical protein
MEDEIASFAHTAVLKEHSARLSDLRTLASIYPILSQHVSTVLAICVSNGNAWVGQ